MTPFTTPHHRVPSWRDVRHYAYADCPFPAAGAKLAESPHEVLGAERSARAGVVSVALRAHRGGLEMLRTVSVRFGELVCEDETARMALRWQDSRHAIFFPIFEGILSLAPVSTGRLDITQVGLVGRYRPPLGAAGAMADRLAGGEVTEEVIAAFVDGIAGHLEALIGSAVAVRDDDGGTEARRDKARHSRVLIAVDGLAVRRSGALVELEVGSPPS